MADVPSAALGPDALRRFVPLLAGTTWVSAVLIQPGTLVENLVALAGAAPFALWSWRGQPSPLVLTVMVAAVQLFALRSGALEPLLFLVSLAAVVVGGWERSRPVLVVAGFVAAATPFAAESLHHNGFLWGVWVMGILLPLGMSRAFRWQLALAHQLARAREEIARQAVVDEKRRIARDVHDLVGHGLAAVLLHVTGARHVLRRDVDAADEALVDAEEVGRRSLQELRRTLQMLRSSDSEGARAAPVAGVPELVDVVESARAEGLDVDLRVEGDVQRIDPVVGLSLHRVTEESLANVRRHAPGAVTDVRLVVEESGVTLAVDSIGPVEQIDPDDADRPRYGIIGMRERMAAVGGELKAGPTPTGWLVRCWAPLPAADGTNSSNRAGRSETRGLS